MVKVRVEDVILESEGPVGTLKLLTYNVGLNSVTMCGLSVFGNPPYGKERLQYQQEALLKSGADIIALQECFFEKDIQALRQALKDVYPHAAWERKTHCCLQNCFSGISNSTFPFSNGLVLFSKYPIISFELEVLKGQSFIEWAVKPICNMNAIVEVPSVGKVVVVNMHTTINIPAKATGEVAERMREGNLQQALAFCQLAGGPAVIMGDYNCGPEASKGNYEFMSANGYRDAFLDDAEAVGRRFRYTWDPQNYLNRIGPHSSAAPQRIDHVFLSPAMAQACDNARTSAEIVLTEEVVPVGDKMATLSDHYGLLVTLQLKAAEPGDMP